MKKSQSYSELRVILSTLTEKEAQVIIARFGISNQEPQTLEQVGKKFGVTRERIRQIEAKALRKLQTKVRQINSQSNDYLD